MSRVIWIFVLGMTFSMPAMAVEKVFITIEGMYCGLCIGGVVKHINQSTGVKNSRVFLQDGKILVNPTGRETLDLNQVKRQVDKSTYNFREFTLRGTGQIKKSGGALYFTPEGSVNRYRLGSMSGALKSKANSAAGSGKSVSIRGNLVQKGSDYQLNLTSVK